MFLFYFDVVVVDVYVVIFICLGWGNIVFGILIYVVGYMRGYIRRCMIRYGVGCMVEYLVSFW